MIETEILVAIGIFFGCLMRAVIPFLKKKSATAKSGEQVRWESRYVWTLIFNIAISLTTAILVLPTFQIPPEYVFPYAFAFGWASQDIMNMLAK